MKYSVEIENGVAKETLIFNGKEYMRTSRITNYGSVSDDEDFNEQMENEGLPNDVLNQIYDTLDGLFVNDLLDVAENEKTK